MLASRRLPAPLMSSAGPGCKPAFEGQGPGGSIFFCPGSGFPKVGGRCTHFWWIWWLCAAKSLILEQKCITKWSETSTKQAFSSTKPVFSSTTLFFGFSSLSLSFSFVNKEEEEEKASTKEGRRSTNSEGCLFFHPPVGLRFSLIWWMVVDVICFVFNGLVCDPPISSNPPWFSPSPPEEVFS